MNSTIYIDTGILVTAVKDAVSVFQQHIQLRVEFPVPPFDTPKTTVPLIVPLKVGFENVGTTVNDVPDIESDVPKVIFAGEELVLPEPISLEVNLSYSNLESVIAAWSNVWKCCRRS